MPNSITGSARKRGRPGDKNPGHIEYVIEPDENRKLNVKMTRDLVPRNPGSDCQEKDSTANFAENVPFRLCELIASLVEHGDLEQFFKQRRGQRSTNNKGFMSAVLDDIGFDQDWVEQTRSQLTKPGHGSETGDGQ